MFQPDWMVSRLAQEHRDDLLRQAKQSQQAKRGKAVSKPHRHAAYHALDWTGRQLVMVGHQLQARHTARHQALHILRGEL